MASLGSAPRRSHMGVNQDRAPGSLFQSLVTRCYRQVSGRLQGPRQHRTLILDGVAQPSRTRKNT